MLKRVCHNVLLPIIKKKSNLTSRSSYSSQCYKLCE
nr:MAG TPA: hypothetical protein [Crassvirales sp.]